jgi:hypothetical protein
MKVIDSNVEQSGVLSEEERPSFGLDSRVVQPQETPSATETLEIQSPAIPDDKSSYCCQLLDFQFGEGISISFAINCFTVKTNC